jgi:CBS domain-containing protein
MKNQIAERIADFLKRFPPFDSVNESDLINICQNVQVVYIEKNKTLFKVGDQPHSFFYVVKDGAIGLSVSTELQEALIDKCDEGDIFGLRPFFAKDNYLMNAQSREESLLYAIPIELFRPLIAKNPEVQNFLLQSFASNTRNPKSNEHRGKLISENVIYESSSSEMLYFQPVQMTKNPITSTAATSVKEIAQIMTRHRVGSILIEQDGFPLGIITDKDLRSKIATGAFEITTTAEYIMSSPVLTVPDPISIAEAQLIMLKNNVGHLCVTLDGTTRSKITGIISEHDVIVSQSNNPGVFLKQVKRAQNTQELKSIRKQLTDFIQNSIQQNLPITHLASITGEINAALTQRAIELTIDEIKTSPPVDFAWLNIGSQGRKEQMLLTDQDHALVFSDVDSDDYESVKAYFLKLASSVTQKLHEIGFELCPAQMMASNPLWCKSLSEWKEQFNQWILHPGEKGILMCSIFFDFETIFGSKEFSQQLHQHIMEIASDNQLFLAYLGSDALKNPPPLGFFRQFLVEPDGEHKDAFDIKSRAIMPLVDAARLLTLSQKLRDGNSTWQRFKMLAENEPQNAEMYQACYDAFTLLIYFRTLTGLQEDSSGRYLNINTLSKSDKVKLKNAFKPIHDIQEVIKNRFQLTYFT